MLTELRLTNFKAFGETQRIPIKPLTLIFGANSSGKSSLLHGLLLFHEALSQSRLDMHALNISGFSCSLRRPNLDVYQPKLAGNLIDLGGFRSFAHGHDVNGYTHIGLTVDLKNPTLRKRLELARADDLNEPRFGEFQAEWIASFLEKHTSVGVTVSLGIKPCRRHYLWPRMVKKDGETNFTLKKRAIGKRITPGVVQVQKCEILLDHT